MDVDDGVNGSCAAVALVRIACVNSMGLWDMGPTGVHSCLELQPQVPNYEGKSNAEFMCPSLFVGCRALITAVVP